MMFVLWALAFVFALSGFYGLNNWLPTYLDKELQVRFGSMAGYMIGTYVVAFPSSARSSRAGSAMYGAGAVCM